MPDQRVVLAEPSVLAQPVELRCGPDHGLDRWGRRIHGSLEDNSLQPVVLAMEGKRNIAHLAQRHAQGDGQREALADGRVIQSGV